MFFIAIYESRQDVRTLLRQHIAEYAFQTNLIHQTLWMTCMPSLEKRLQFFPQVQLALLSLDMPNTQQIAAELYQCNKDCRIIFFSEAASDLVPLLSVRPIGFYQYMNHTNPPSSLGELLASVISDIRTHTDSFAIESKDGLYILKTDCILYFQSELKNVSIQCDALPAIQLVRKLSEIQRSLAEQHLEDAFIRIHQSYIVNKAHICHLDKRNHWIALSNGEQLPVSDSKYEAVRKALHTSGDQPGFPPDTPFIP